MKEGDPCGNCSGSFRFLWKAEDNTGHSWNYESCIQCGWIRLVFDPSPVFWQNQAYPSGYYGGGYSKFSGAIQWLRQLSARRRARELSRFFNQPGRVLDIGCGEGLFLESMKNLGWEIGGCETGETAVKRTEERIGQPIHRGEFETMNASPKGWDLVMLWHVLEHVSSPESLLRQIHAAMAPKALLVVAIPNAASWQAWLFGPHWFHLDPPRHLSSMRLSHLRQLAQKAGFEEIEAHHFSLEYNPFGWAQSFLNSLGFRRDALYETLKNQARAEPGIQNSEFTSSTFANPRDAGGFPTTPKRSVATASGEAGASADKQDSAPFRGGWGFRALAWLLLAPSIVPAVMEAIASCGGTVAVYFRRKETNK